VLVLQRDVDHVRPGLDPRCNMPPSVPTARSTARLAASSLQHGPRRRAASSAVLSLGK
jgi:hypothetical protein